jgi:hypothetical protein
VRGESSLRPAHRHRIIHNLPLDQLRFHIAIAKVSANTAATVINRAAASRIASGIDAPRNACGSI